MQDYVPIHGDKCRSPVNQTDFWYGPFNVFVSNDVATIPNSDGATVLVRVISDVDITYTYMVCPREDVVDAFTREQYYEKFCELKNGNYYYVPPKQEYSNAQDDEDDDGAWMQHCADMINS